MKTEDVLALANKCGPEAAQKALNAAPISDGPFGYEFIAGTNGNRGRYRIHDGQDNAMASSFHEGDARHIVRALNAE